jgi:hypothetical protein
VERLWSHFASLFPAQQRNIGENMFKFLSDLSFLRLCYTHFNKPWLQGWARRDALLVQRAEDMAALLREAGDEECTAMEAELAHAWRQLAERAHGDSGSAASVPEDEL